MSSRIAREGLKVGGNTCHFSFSFRTEDGEREGFQSFYRDQRVPKLARLFPKFLHRLQRDLGPTSNEYKLSTITTEGDSSMMWEGPCYSAMNGKGGSNALGSQLNCPFLPSRDHEEVEDAKSSHS